MSIKISLAIAEDSDTHMGYLQFALNTYKNIKLGIKASNGQELIDQISETNMPDVVLMDIKMPLLNGISTTLHLKEKFPEIKIIAYTLHDNEELVEQMLKSGAVCYMFKNSPVEYLTEGIEAVHRNQFHQNRDIHSSILMEYRYKHTQHENVSLTRKEVAILNMICEGHINKEISNALDLRVGTVNAYRNNLLQKTRSRNTAELIRFAILTGLFFPSFDTPSHSAAK